MLWQLLISFCQDDECGPNYRSAQGFLCPLTMKDRPFVPWIEHIKKVYNALREEITNSPLVVLLALSLSLFFCIEMKAPGISLHAAQ